MIDRATLDNLPRLSSQNLAGLHALPSHRRRCGEILYARFVRYCEDREGRFCSIVRELRGERTHEIGSCESDTTPLPGWVAAQTGCATEGALAKFAERYSLYDYYSDGGWRGADPDGVEMFAENDGDPSPYSLFGLALIDAVGACADASEVIPGKPFVAFCGRGLRILDWISDAQGPEDGMVMVEADWSTGDQVIRRTDCEEIANAWIWEHDLPKGGAA